MSGTGPSEIDRSSSGGVATARWMLLGASALFVLPGCGAILESAVENAVEEAAGVEVEEGEDGSFSIEGGDISIQLDTDEEGGTLSIDGPDGSVQVDASEDGTVNVTSEDFEGEEDSELSITADAEVPDGFPLPYPDGGVVESGTTWDTGDRQLMTVAMRYEASKLEAGSIALPQQATRTVHMPTQHHAFVRMIYDSRMSSSSS